MAATPKSNNNKVENLFECINPQGREELVGKRFLLVSTPSSPKPKLSRISEWNWKAGVIRCASHADVKEPELQILVEFDDVDWDTREWLNVYKENYHLLAVEQTLVLANRGPNNSVSPALTFKPLVDSVGLYAKGPKAPAKQPVEFLSDLKLDFQDCSKLRIITHWDPKLPGLNTSSINQETVDEWSDFQRSQHLLTHGSSYMFGLRLKVYRAEGTTQWYTAVTTGYSTSSLEYTLTDDTVLEEHYEDPRLTQMLLLGGRPVIESILRGDNVTPRRSRSAAIASQLQLQQQQPTTPSALPVSRTRQQQQPSLALDAKSKKKPKQLSLAEITDSSSESSSSSSSSVAAPKPRGRPAKPKKNPNSPATTGKRKDNNNDDEEEEDDDEEAIPDEMEDNNEDIDAEDESLVKTRGRKSKVRKSKASNVSPSRDSKPAFRKKAAKRSASVAALAAISDTTSKEAEIDDDLLKPLAEPKQQKKAVAIVRPQPQQLNNNEDREARFSLYDFPSDSETEADRPSSSKAAKESKKATPPQQQQQKPVVPFKKQFSSKKISIVKSPIPSAASASPGKKKSEEDSPQSSGCSVITSGAAVASTNSNNNAEKMQDQDARTTTISDRSPDSGVSSSRPNTEAERSGSRSSTLSCDDLKVKSMGDRQQPPQQPQPQQSRPPVQPQQQQQQQASAAAAAASGLMSQHYALQYQAAMQQAFSAGAAGNHLAQAQLLAYQQSLQAALTPDMILKQYPHLAAAGLAAPPHLLGGRNPAADHHLMLQQQAREREMVDRQQRERRESEQRERERQEKERQEHERRERLERERQERERREREHAAKQLSAVEAVDHHFQLSMELAKKRMAANSSHPWVPMTGAKPGGAHPPGHPSHPAMINLEEERRRFESEAAARKVNDHFMNSLRPPAVTSALQFGGVVSPPPAHGSPLRKMSPMPSSSNSLRHKMDPGPPPPLAPLQGQAYGGLKPQQPQNNSGVSFKPYDFARRDVSSPRSGGSSGFMAYPTAYSAPPPSSRPKASSPQVVNMYSNPAPARPESSPATPMVSSPSSGPPPAHSGTSSSSSSRPSYLAPPAAPGAASPVQRQPLPAPPPLAHSLVHRPMASEDMPLDLGAKRKAETEEAMPTPSKNIKLEAADEKNGVLFKVTEPSVLLTSEASTITTVENLAIKKEPKVEPKLEPKDETREEPEMMTAEAAAAERTYVHKLKKAWIKSYTVNESDVPKKNPAGDYSAPSTPNNRATPSPAPSNASQGKGKVNGHVSKNDESESSDSNGSNRGVAVVKSKVGSSSSSVNVRGNGKKSASGPGRGGIRGVGRPKQPKASDNETLSDSDSKDSDATTSSKRSASVAAKGRRGRKPGKKGRGGGNRAHGVNHEHNDGDNQRGSSEISSNGKSSKNNSKEGNGSNPFNNPPVSVLKKTGESFLQDADCFKVAPKLGKCRECKWSQHNKNAGSSASIFCRFYGFRRLKYHVKNGQMAVAGFCDPYSKEDVTPDDAEMWEASAENAPVGLTVDQAKYCLELLKTDFDLIVKEERKAIHENIGEDNVVSWKRVVQGVSESCDVCDATLFNLHWACPRCGFVVCLHCYVGRKNRSELVNGDSKNESSNSSGSSASKDDKDKHSWLLCTNRAQHDLDKLMLTQIVTGNALEELNDLLNNCGLKFRIARATAEKRARNGNNGIISNGGPEKGASLRDLIGSEQKVKMSDIIDACVEGSFEADSETVKLAHYVRSTDLEEDKNYKWRHGFVPKSRCFSLLETKSQYPSVPHSWLANGSVLRMEGNTDSEAAIELFQETWSRGQPVIVSNATKALNISKWYPNNLNDEFGEEEAELVDLLTGQSFGDHPLKKFWDGYGSVSKRLKDQKGQPAILKVSGWPGTFGDEFKETLPSRSAEFLRMLPMQIYAGRAGPLNLAASLPETFARAEVGPRAIITYGDIESAESGALQVERADSVVVCVHAQIPKNESLDSDEFRSMAVKVLEKLGCDSAAVAKAREERLPASVWTIFHPADGDKIRDLLNKVSNDKSRPLNYDPLLHGDVLLNEGLIKRLKDEYDVKPYVIAQFQGEAVFIPAGSPRQVKHLLSSISLESDFLSPENVSQSFFMYRQLRHLCDAQKQPVVDRLSVKNLIFHSVKNALATLKYSNGKKDNDDDEES